MFDVLKFGSHIVKLRKAADMTQSELADKINLTRQAVSKYERGDSFPDISILLLIAEAFGTSIDKLISAGEPTKTEAEILLYKSTSDFASTDEILNIAPFIKPSVLLQVTEKLKKQGIDITHLVALSEYMNTKNITELLENINIETFDEELLRRLIPVLDDESKLTVFERIIEGQLDWHYIKILLPFAEYLISEVEAAVIEGALPWEALGVMRNALWEEKNK